MGLAMDVLVRWLNVLLMMAAPLALGVFLTRRLRLDWRLFVIGGVTFVGSQLLHLPFNAKVLTPLLMRIGFSATDTGVPLLLTALAFGISAGLFEEGARILVYGTWLRDARSWRDAIMFGAGHGGIEAILLGGLAAYGLIQAIAYQGADLSALVPADRLDVVRLQLQAYWALPWYGALLGAFERALALCIQVSLAVLVLQAFVRREWRWAVVAIGWHTAVDAVAVFGLRTWGMYATEALVGLAALLSLGVVFVLRDARPEEGELVPDQPLEASALVGSAPGVDEETPSWEQLEESRFL
ncbi:MAG: YhfC family intramembrane metalloprotease [Anaerolineales bacterium]|nr:YhfC family intramembrane metalloprotease [Anaerolineales bacterium]